MTALVATPEQPAALRQRASRPAACTARYCPTMKGQQQGGTTVEDCGSPLHLVVVEAEHGLGRSGGPAVQLVVIAARRQLPVVRRPLQPAHLPQHRLPSVTRVLTGLLNPCNYFNLRCSPRSIMTRVPGTRQLQLPAHRFRCKPARQQACCAMQSEPPTTTQSCDERHIQLWAACLGAVGGKAAGPVLRGAHVPLQDRLVAAAGAEQVAGPGHAAHPRPVPVHRAHPEAHNAIACLAAAGCEGVGKTLLQN